MPEIKLFSRDGHALLFGVENLAVVYGDAGSLERLHASLSRHGNPRERGEGSEAIASVLTQRSPFALDQAVEPAVSQLNVGTTCRCNMRCTYCYNELTTKDEKGSDAQGGMSFDVAKAMIDAFLWQSLDEPVLTLVFTGGEALLEREEIVRAVAYAQERCAAAGKQLAASVYTNGVCLTPDVVRWANEARVDIVVSLDGPPEQNDCHRVFRGGRGSSDVVLRHVRYFQEHSVAAWRRVNAVVTKSSALLPLARYFLDLGFNDIHFQSAYGQADLDDRCGVLDLVELRSWYGSLLLAGTVVAVSPFSPILERIAMRLGNVTSWFPCSSGFSALGVAPNGDVFPCHHFFGEPEFALGNVRDGLPSEEARKGLVARVDEREPCRTCWARHACGGECYHRAHTSGLGYVGIHSDLCDARRAVIEMALDLYSEIGRKRPDVLGRLASKRYSHVPPLPGAFEIRTL